jgi:hypothetical protein
MTVDQLDELIRKYLSTGVAMVLVLVGPAAAPSGATAPKTAATSTHSTGATPTNSRSADHATKPTTDEYRAKPTAKPDTTHDPDADPRAKPTAKPDTTHDPTAEPRAKPTADSDTTGKPTADSRAKPTADPEENGRPRRDPPDDGPTAAATHGWGTPNREDDFTEDLSGWGIYDGPGHADEGTRSPDAASVADGVLTINGDAEGTTAGMAWGRGKGQKYGRWEGRVRAPASDPTYNALLLLWPDAEDFPEGGEIDFMEMTDHTRQSTNVFLHHGEDNAQEHGTVEIDATRWHNWAVEWTPKGVTTYVDGEQWWHTDEVDALPPGPMHLCIQLDWFPQKRAGAVKPSQMQVDWVRQYPVDAPQSDESVMRDLVQRTFGW